MPTSGRRPPVPRAPAEQPHSAQPAWVVVDDWGAGQGGMGTGALAPVRESSSEQEGDSIAGATHASSICGIGHGLQSSAMPESQTNHPASLELLLELPGPGPLHRRLGDALRGAIISGRLAPGYVLPPSRQLAEELGCSRWVVTEAYGQLSSEGHLETRTGSSTRVGPRSAPSAGRTGEATGHFTPVRIDLAPGLPDLHAFPTNAWADALRREARMIGHPDLGYPPPRGHPRFRSSVAGLMRRVRNADADHAELTAARSVNEAARWVGEALVSNGITHIAVEDPGWPRLQYSLRAAGLHVVPIRLDQQGLRVDLLRDHPHVRAVLVTPNHQFPTGTAMSADRRASLVAWAQDVEGVILEDDYDAEYRYDRRPIGVLQSLAPDRVILMKSLSKTLSPALGIGWVLAPSWLSRLAEETTPGAPPVLDQLAFTYLVEQGTYDRHLRRMRRLYRRRRDLLASRLALYLPDAHITGTAAGLHLVLRLPPEIDARSAVARMAQKSLRTVDMTAYSSVASAGVNDPPPHLNCLVIGYGNLGDRRVDEAARIVASACSSSHDPPKPASQ